MNTWTNRALIVSLSALSVLALQACGDSGPAAVATNHPCASTDVIALNVYQSANVTCAAGGVIQLAGGGARYLVVPEFAGGDLTNRAISYVMSDSDAVPVQASVSASIRGTASPHSFARPAASRGPGVSQIRFDAALRSFERKAVASGQWSRTASGAKSAARASVVRPSASVPPVGSVRSFRVINTFSVQNATFTTVNAKLQFVGANALVYLDTLSPSNGFTPQQLAAFGEAIDQTFFTMDVDTFGPPSDIDGNGRVIVLLSPVVNAITDASTCGTDGYVAGFFYGFDLSSTGSNSNLGEIYYGLVPDPTGSVSCAHSAATVASIAPGTFLHEVEHMISYSQHVVVHGGSAEEGWLDEGLAIFAQELGSQYYERKFPPPSGRTNPSQLLPDSAEGFIADQFSESFLYLERPDTSTLTLHSDADGGLTWRAGDWLLAHWLGDQEGVSIYKRLEESTLTGTANISATAGEPFSTLFGDFGISLWADSIPGVSKSEIPQRNRFTTRTLRTIFQAVYAAGGTDAATPFPIAPRSLSGEINASMVPGTMTYYELDTSTGAAASTLRFSPAAGGTFPSALHAQVSIFRIQ